jgi:hypothetical protein
MMRRSEGLHFYSCLESLNMLARFGSDLFHVEVGQRRK